MIENHFISFNVITCLTEMVLNVPLTYSRFYNIYKLMICETQDIIPFVQKLRLICFQTAKEVWELIKEEKRRLTLGRNPNAKISDSLYYESSTFAYDATWAIAKALDQMVKENVNLSSFTYQNYTMADMLGAKVHGVQLEGVTVSYYLAFNTLQSCKTINLSSKLRQSCKTINLSSKRKNM